MGTVLIDNWNLTNATLIRKDNTNIPNESYSDLLSALVLWDEVCYLDEGFSTFGWLSTPEGQRLKQLLKPLHIESDMKINFEDSSNIIYEKEFFKVNKKIVAQRAIYYHEISKAFNMNYYPVRERADFLDGYIDNLELWSRKEILKSEEREILKRIQEFNCSKEAFVQIPLLTNLIIKNTYKDYINTALEIKDTREVRAFRKYMDEIDRQINIGNYSEVRHILNLMPYIIDEIENMDRKLSMTVTVRLKIAPMVLSMIVAVVLSSMYTENALINMGLICFTLKEALGDSSIDIEKKWTSRGYPKKMQINFLRTLAKEYIG